MPIIGFAIIAPLEKNNPFNFFDAFPYYAKEMLKNKQVIRNHLNFFKKCNLLLIDLIDHSCENRMPIIIINSEPEKEISINSASANLMPSFQVTSQ
jgi:hypothetical protein